MALLHVKQLGMRLITGVGVGNEQTIFTVPAGYRYVVRTIEARNLLGSGANALNVYVDTILWLFYSVPVSGTSMAAPIWNGWLVLEPGDLMKARVGNAAGVNVIVSGSHYTV